MASGANVVVSQGAISEMAMHFIERAGLMAVRLQSKFDNRRCATPCCILHAARSLLYVVRSMSRPASFFRGFESIKHVLVRAWLCTRLSINYRYYR